MCEEKKTVKTYSFNEFKQKFRPMVEGAVVISDYTPDEIGKQVAQDTLEAIENYLDKLGKSKPDNAS